MPKRGGRVLIVEDDQSIQEVLLEAFGDEGWDARTARDGEEALAVLSDWRADVIVLDLMTPNMDGWQFRAEQRALRHVAALRRLVEAFDHGFARGVLATPVGAPFERIVRRRLEVGAGAHAGGAARDARIEQRSQRRIGRRLVRPVRLGARRPRRVLLAVLGRIARRSGGFRHCEKYGWSRGQKEG